MCTGGVWRGVHIKRAGSGRRASLDTQNKVIEMLRLIEEPEQCSRNRDATPDWWQDYNLAKKEMSNYCLSHGRNSKGCGIVTLLDWATDENCQYSATKKTLKALVDIFAWT